jgi:asparagine synthetase B (glutamine-hydrolysing)
MLIKSIKSEVVIESSDAANPVVSGESGLRIRSKGYFFDSSGKAYFDAEISAWLLRRISAEDLSGIAGGMNGSFSVIIHDSLNRKIICVSDRFGTVPVYYYFNQTSLFVSDQFMSVARQLDNIDIDPDSARELILAGYVTGNRTLAKSIYEVGAASIITFGIHSKKGFVVKEEQRYWKLSYASRPSVTEGGLAIRFREILDDVFSRFANALNARNLHSKVLLSGGIDSRLLLTSFINNNYHSISALSYGAIDDPEVAAAKKTAEYLHVPQTVDIVADPDFLTREFIEERIKIMGETTRFTSAIGLRHTLLNHSLKMDCLISGHSISTTTGHGLVPEVFGMSNVKDVYALIFDTHFPLVEKKNITGLFGKEAIERQMAKIQQEFDTDPDDLIGSYERWNFENRQRKLILRELRTWATIARWMLPYYDHRFIDFFASVPYPLRYKQKLYINALLQDERVGAVFSLPVYKRGILKKIERESFAEDYLCRRPGTFLAGLYGRGFRIKRRIRESRQRYACSNTGPIPLEYWWHHTPGFREKLRGLVRESQPDEPFYDKEYLDYMLSREKVSSRFIHAGIPSVLTLNFMCRCLKGRPADDL